MKSLIVIATASLIPLVIQSAHADTANNDFVKKSSNGYCHYLTSAFYERTRRFERYEKLVDCLEDGGQMPPTNESYKSDSLVKFSLSGLCHTIESAYFKQTRNYVAFSSLEDCVRHGGRK